MQVLIKKCRVCEIEKDIKDFPASKNGRDGTLNKCKICHAKYQREYIKANPHILRQQGLRRRGVMMTLDHYDQLAREQNNKCAICNREETMKSWGKIRMLSVDHDHKTGKIRGLLCSHCNQAIGLLKDDITRLKSAIAYLEQDSSGL